MKYLCTHAILQQPQTLYVTHDYMNGQTLQRWCSEDWHPYLRAVPQLLPQLPATFRPHGVLGLVQDGDGFGNVTAHILLGGSQARNQPTHKAGDAVWAGRVGFHSREFSRCDDLERDEPHCPA